MESGAEAYNRFLNGDDSGLEQVIDCYKDSLIFFLIRYVARIDIAEELTEDTFVTLAVKRPRYTESAQFRTWLYTIARNKALNYLRSGAHRKNVPIEQAEEIPCIDCAEQKLLTEERYRSLYAAMGKLCDSQRDMLYFVYFEEMSVADAARVIRKTARQGSSILFRARAALKCILEKEGFVYEEQL